MTKVKATKKAQQTTAQHSVNIDAIAQRTAESARERKADAVQRTADTLTANAQKDAEKRKERKADATAKKTSFVDVVSALEHVAKFVTVQNNSEHAYARICFTDDFKRDFYRVCKDFAVYYDRRDSFKISVADSTLTDCTVFKADYQRTEKTRALEFSVKADALKDTLTEIIAQRLLQTTAVLNVTFAQKSATKQRKAQSKAQ